jgi:hypothetical protein
MIRTIHYPLLDTIVISIRILSNMHLGFIDDREMK